MVLDREIGEQDYLKSDWMVFDRPAGISDWMLAGCSNKEKKVRVRRQGESFFGPMLSQWLRQAGNMQSSQGLVGVRMMGGDE